MSSNSSGANNSLLATTHDVPCGAVRACAFRFEPEADLVESLRAAARSTMKKTGTSSCFVMTAVGSLSDVTLRLANACKTTKNKDDDEDNNNNTPPTTNEIRRWKERFEVTSLVGTFISTAEKFHLHMSVANAEGVTFGGHVIAGTVFTTMEIVLGTIAGIKFDRRMDEKTGYGELVVLQQNGNNEEKEIQFKKDSGIRSDEDNVQGKNEVTKEYKVEEEEKHGINKKEQEDDESNNQQMKKVEESVESKLAEPNDSESGRKRSHDEIVATST